MSTFVRRLILLLFALSGAFVGFWAYFAPGSWYRSFPGLGLRWLPVLGPYNEHLAKDVGAMYLALTVLSLVAVRRAENALLVQAAGLAWLVFGVPHLVYHLQHLDMYGTRDQVLNAVSLSLFVVGAVVLLLPGAARSAPRGTTKAAPLPR
ncbi:hypothetical protein AB0F77_39820 [Streptomyces sp. NPDC026672]|uniref:hypothetical protein n=1 Tax=unclassified Streptomyces TaxID=2593676 RepID=UPI0034069B9C